MAENLYRRGKIWWGRIQLGIGNLDAVLSERIEHHADHEPVRTRALPVLGQADHQAGKTGGDGLNMSALTVFEPAFVGDRHGRPSISQRGK